MSNGTNLEGDFELKCAFLEKCSLPKMDSLCYKSPDFTICPEYNERKDKLLTLTIT